MKTSKALESHRWGEYRTTLYRFILARVKDSAVAEDIVQDVLIKVYQRINTLKDKEKILSWMYRITRNTIIDYYRSKRSTEELPDWIEQPQPEKERVIRAELSSCLDLMVEELPDKYRKAVQMSEFENKTQQEVATIEGISLSGAKSRVQRGRALLKTMLHDCCQIELNKDNQVLSYEKRDHDCKFC
jgi:RNA polymerase sigma-70 factor, ECF subfamily